MEIQEGRQWPWLPFDGADPRRGSGNASSYADVLARFPNGVALITSITDEGELVGLATGSFFTVSASPLVVGFLADRSSPALRQVLATSSFCVNVLAADQERLCRKFASGQPSPFDGIGWRPAPSGAPILDGAVSWLDCDRAGASDVGDQGLVLGNVTSLRMERDVLPLLQFQQGYGTFAPGSLVTYEAQSFSQAGPLVEAARDVIDLLARELAVECSVLACAGREAVFVATANHAAASGPTRLGFRVPIAAPLCALFAGAPGAPTEQEWLASLPPSAGGEAHALARLQLERVRRRGWSISLRGRLTAAELDEIVARYTRPGSTAEDEDRVLAYAREMMATHEIADLREHDFYNVQKLAAPVRTPTGDTIGMLRLGNLPPRPSGAEVNFWVTQLLEAAAAVERGIHDLGAADPAASGAGRWVPAQHG